ncbi:MAG TPA: hypothetical protein K8W15_10320 [Gallibacterium anatis]|uniref:Lytic protein Rz1 n=1 Tax=Gallibacterium anatis TaxID=750 RepID=A0A921L239_9PAST|nr:hypothetical protein [Gallibacterium anatis]
MRLLKIYRQSKRTVIVIGTTLLSLLLSSCSSEPVQCACSPVPPAYLTYLDKTHFKGQSYGDVAQYAVILKRERDICLNRIDRIREWQTEHAQH